MLVAKLLCCLISICSWHLVRAEVIIEDESARSEKSGIDAPQAESRRPLLSEPRRLPGSDGRPALTRQKSSVKHLEALATEERKEIYTRTWVYGVFLLLISPMLALAMVYSLRRQVTDSVGDDTDASRGSVHSVVEDISDEAQIKDTLLPFSNCFIDEAIEESYVQANAETLCNHCFWVVVAVGAYAFYETIFTYDIRARVIFKPIVRRWDSNARVVYNSTWITMSLSSFVTAGIMWHCSKDRRKRHMDKLMAAWAFMIFLLMMFTGNRYNACSLFSEDPLDSFTHYDADSKMVLNFIVLIMVMTLHTPVRFCILAPIVLVLPFVYVVQSIWLGGPDGGLWTIAFGYPHPAFLGEMGFMDFSQAMWFFSIIILIMLGQRHLETKKRCDFKVIAESAKLIQEMQEEDTGQKGTSQLQKATDALTSVEQSLKELSNHRAIVKNALSDEMTRLIKQIHIAQKTLKNADRLFDVNVSDLMQKHEFSEYKDNKDIQGFVAMTGAVEAQRGSVYELSQRSTVLPMIKGRHQSVKREPQIASKLDAELVKVLDSIGHVAQLAFSRGLVSEVTGRRVCPFKDFPYF
jgi:hypothetical protein